MACGMSCLLCNAIWTSVWHSFTGAGPQIAANARVQDSILWDEVIIGPGASVNRAVLGDRVRIDAGDVVENAVVVRADVIAGRNPPAKALHGELRGENFVVHLSQ